MIENHLRRLRSPPPNLIPPGEFPGAKIVHAIRQDSQGRMWFATNGGAYVYDGESLTNISEKEGLCHNSLNDILEDKDGNFWFATHHNGVCRWDGKSFTHINSKDGVNGTEAWKLYSDSSGNVWFPIEHSGIYRYDGKSFTNFHRQQGLTSEAIQCFLEDREGRVWVGGVFGLFRFDGNSFFSSLKRRPVEVIGNRDESWLTGKFLSTL